MFPILLKIPNVSVLATELVVVECVIGVVLMLAWLALRSRGSKGYLVSALSTGAVLVGLHILLSLVMKEDQPITIYSFGVVIIIAFLAAIYFMTRQTKQLGLDTQKVFDWGFWLLVTGILGSRLLFAFLNYEQFENNKLEVFRIWNGGLVWYGGLIPAVVVGIVLLRRFKLPVLLTSDICCVGLMLALGMGRWACLLAGDDYGSRTDAWIGIRFYHEDCLVPLALRGELLHPTQLYMSLNALWLFFGLEFLRRRARHAGTTFAAMLIAYAVTRAAFIEPFRGDFVERNPGYKHYVATQVRIDMDGDQGLVLPRGTPVRSADGRTGELLDELKVDAGERSGAAWAITDGPAKPRKRAAIPVFETGRRSPPDWNINAADGAPTGARISASSLRWYNSDLSKPPGYVSTSQWISFGIVAAGIGILLLSRRLKAPGFHESVEIAQREAAD